MGSSTNDKEIGWSQGPDMSQKFKISLRQMQLCQGL